MFVATFKVLLSSILRGRASSVRANPLCILGLPGFSVCISVRLKSSLCIRYC